MSDPKRETTKREVYDTPRATGTRNGDVRVVGARACESFNLDALDAAELLHFVAVVVRNGDLVSFTQTSDGGTLCITVLCGKRQLKAYGRQPETIYARMSDILEVAYA